MKSIDKWINYNGLYIFVHLPIDRVNFDIYETGAQNLVRLIYLNFMKKERKNLVQLTPVWVPAPELVKFEAGEAFWASTIWAIPSDSYSSRPS